MTDSQGVLTVLPIVIRAWPWTLSPVLSVPVCSHLHHSQHFFIWVLACVCMWGYMHLCMHMQSWGPPSWGFTLNWELGWQSANPSDPPISTDPGLGLQGPSIHVFLCEYWGLDSDLQACKPSTLPTETHLPSPAFSLISLVVVPI